VAKAAPAIATTRARTAKRGGRFSPYREIIPTNH
jgi:hypothetical protein